MEYTVREQIMTSYRRAARGEIDVHAWRSFNKDVLMNTVVVEPATGEALPQEDRWDAGRDINLEWEVYYSGIMPREEAAERLHDMEFADLLETELM